MTPEKIIAAHTEVARLTRELDITNADHIALWLEANVGGSSLAWLACRIVEAHETALTAQAQRIAELEAALRLCEQKSDEPITVEWIACAALKGGRDD